MYVIIRNVITPSVIVLNVLEPFFKACSLIPNWCKRKAAFNLIVAIAFTSLSHLAFWTQKMIAGTTFVHFYSSWKSDWSFQSKTVLKEMTASSNFVHLYSNKKGPNLIHFLPHGKGRESLLKGKAQYGWPPRPDQLRSVAFYIENIIYLCYKTSYLNEEVKCTEPSPSVSVPW